jgi:transitional endoplasmic reticulum ATPase
VDRIEDVLNTAKLYEPAVVFVEDIDGTASSSDDDAVARLLEAFDGITAKGGELVVVMTTNHKERIHKGMLRPGRLDTVIEINSLDRESVERLIKVVVPTGKLNDVVDFDAVFAAMDGFYPAFVREAVERAKTFAVSRGKGALNYVLTTDDIVKAALSLRPQLDELNGAKEGERRPELEAALAKTITAATQQGVHGTKVDERHDGLVLSVPALNGQGSH